MHIGSRLIKVGDELKIAIFRLDIANGLVGRIFRCVVVGKRLIEERGLPPALHPGSIGRSRRLKPHIRLILLNDTLGERAEFKFVEHLFQRRQISRHP